MRLLRSRLVQEKFSPQFPVIPVSRPPFHYPHIFAVRAVKNRHLSSTNTLPPLIRIIDCHKLPREVIKNRRRWQRQSPDVIENRIDCYCSTDPVGWFVTSFECRVTLAPTSSWMAATRSNLNRGSSAACMLQ